MTNSLKDYKECVSAYIRAEALLEADNPNPEQAKELLKILNSDSTGMIIVRGEKGWGLDSLVSGLQSKIAPQLSKITDPNLNLDDYIILEGRTHGSYSYPDLLVAKQKTLHNRDWPQTHQELHKNNQFMLTIRQYVDFLNLLKSGTAYNGNRNKLSQTELDQILDEILTQRNPWRAEWLDVKFNKCGRNLNITYHKIKDNGTLEEVTELLESCLMKDCYVDILNSANRQGLPTRETNSGIYYWRPRNGSVARFGAGSGGVILYCCRFPSVSSSGLGVRCVKIAEGDAADSSNKPPSEKPEGMGDVGGRRRWME